MSKIRILRVALLALAAPVALLAQGKLGGLKSSAEYEKAVQADSNDATAHYLLALGYWNDKKWPEVKRELTTALTLDPRMAPAHLTFAMVPYAERKTLWTESISGQIPGSMAADVAASDQHFKMAFWLDPMVNTSIIATVATVSDATDFGKGVVACNEGRYPDCDAAITKYFSTRQGSSVARVPKSVYWYNGLAVAHSKKDYAGAGGIWGTLANRKEDDTRVVASTDLARIPLMSNDIDFLIGVLSHLYNNGSNDALATYQRVVGVDPTLYLAHVYMANIYDAQRNYDKSIAERMEAMKANPNEPILHYELGLTYAKAGKLPEAIQHLTTATTLMPRNAQAWAVLGQAKDASGDKAGAKEAYAKVLTTASARQAPLVASAKAKMGG